MPLITVSAGTATVENVVVDIPLPTFTNVDTVSSLGLCSGTTIAVSLRVLRAGESRTIDVSLNATTAGSLHQQHRADGDQ
jgi:hypothetical protein